MNKMMPLTELEDYILHKNASQDSWDSDLSGESPVGMKKTALKEYLERANQAGRIDFTYTTKEEALSRLGMLQDGKVKNAAVALFCKKPLFEVQMAIFATSERLTFNDIKRKSGNVQKLVKNAEKYIRSNIHWRVVLDGSLQRKEIPEIPMDAVREALINSYCHRDYNSSQNNEISIYSNRVEIYNPGTFPRGLTPQDYIKGNERSVKRNPLLTQLMYYAKDIESFGTGLKRITTACESAGIKVEFQMLKRGFTVVFYRPDSFALADTAIRDSTTENITINETQKKILAHMQKNPKITIISLAKLLGIAEHNVKNHIKPLRQAGYIVRVGPPKGGHWVVNQPE